MVAGTKIPKSRKGQSRELVAKWRAEVPQITRIIEEVAPRMLADSGADLRERVPAVWLELVASMRTTVLDKVDQAKADGRPEESDEELRGYYWSFKIHHISDMVEFLCQQILTDIGIGDGATIPSMLLVRKAFLPLLIELQDGGTKHGRSDGEEYRFRVLEAIKSLTPHFDDVSLRRFRALRVAESNSEWALPVLDDTELEAQVAELQKIQPEVDPEQQRDWFTVTDPVIAGVQGRAFLAQVDERFSALDPLECYEEFVEASAKGGKTEGGDGKTGAARALARLAVKCGALDYQQLADEDFDAAVERARNNLLVNRSRIRKSLRNFPGLRTDDPIDS